MLCIPLKETGGGGGTTITDTLTLTPDGLIETTAGDLVLQPVGGCTKIGSSYTSNRIAENPDDLGVNGSVEINGALHVDSTLYPHAGMSVTGNATFQNNIALWDHRDFALGTVSDAIFRWNLSQTPNTLTLGLGADSNALMLCEKADLATNFSRGLQSDPTLFLMSSTAPSDTTEWVGIAHNGDNPVASSGKGVWEFPDGIRTIVDTSDVTNPPTDAELDSAFGTPAAVGSGFVGIVDDNGAHTQIYLAVSDGTAWHTIAGTLAT